MVEAMKMENELTASGDIGSTLCAEVGDNVEKGALLVSVEAEERVSIRGLILCSMMAGCSLLSTPEAVLLPDAGQVVPDAGVAPVDPCEPNPCTGAPRRSARRLRGERSAHAMSARRWGMSASRSKRNDGDCVGGDGGGASDGRGHTQSQRRGR